jgi:hypothetical protein
LSYTEVSILSKINIKLLRFIDENHPREEYLTADLSIVRNHFISLAPAKKKYSIFSPTGELGFATSESSLLPYGIGIALYFKYVVTH